MIEKLLANPFTGDGTLHPDLHLIYVDEVCGLFKLAGMPEDVIKKKVFPLSLNWEKCHFMVNEGIVINWRV